MKYEQREEEKEEEKCMNIYECDISINYRWCVGILAFLYAAHFYFIHDFGSGSGKRRKQFYLTFC